MKDAPASGGVPAGVTYVNSEEAAKDLAARLLMPGRRWPVAVVTVAAGLSEPYADLVELNDCLRGFAEILVMPTADISWAFSTAMPDGTQVYGGASRVYPVDHEWVSMPRRAPLRFAYSFRERDRVTIQIVADAMSAAVSAGLYPPAATAARRHVRGAVATLLGTRALIRLEDGEVVTLWEELTGLSVPLERLVAPGQSLEGFLDPEYRRLDLLPTQTGLDAESGRLPDTYVRGALVLGEVHRVGAQAITLLLTPKTEVEIGRDDVTGNELDELHTLFARGDVVVARVESQVPLRLSMLDVGDDEDPLAAPALLPGGPPWLLPPPPPLLADMADGSTAIALGSHVSSEPISEAEPVEAATGVAPMEHEAVPALAPPPSTPSDRLAGRLLAQASTPTAPSAAASGPAVRELGLALTAERVRAAGLARQLAETGGAAKELARMRQLAQSLARELELAEQAQVIYRKKYVVADRRRQALERKLKAGHLADDPDPRSWFTDPEDGLRYAVQAAWARRIPAGEKERWPLREWHVGPEFINSLGDLGQVSWSKLAEVIADIVVGDPRRLAALDRHELRTSHSGAARAVVRDDGAICYRVALQQNTPSARRLHYWRRGDYLEMSRVALHDAMAA